MPTGVYLLIGFVIGGIVGWAFGALRNKSVAPTDNRLENELRTQLQQRERELAETRAQSTQTRIF